VTRRKAINSEKSPAVAEDVLHIHVFSHTHWDFEWYEVHEGFKLQLVHLIENLLETLERYPKFKFHFDGQIMPIMDYLEIVKERDNVDNKNRLKEAERKISKFVTRGQLIIGPCWSTPETSLISYESLIRNINRGIRFSKRFGAVSSVFYNADAFQYHSQVPQIIEGAGLKSAFAWRGFKKGKTLKDLSLWKGADKTAIIKYYPPRTYAQTWNLPTDPQDALDLIKREAQLLKHFAVTKHVLITQGNDQFEAQSDVHEIIETVDEMIGKRYEVDHVTLEDFFRTIQKEKPPLGTIQGELTGNQWACTMSGQLSARMPLKQKNKKAEIAIEKWAEPFATFAWLLGDEYPVGLMERAWEYLMKQHFHHCNACAIDEVHREGDVRYNNAIELARDITDESLKNIASRISSADIIDESNSAFVIFNPSDIERTEVVSVEIDIGIPTQKGAEWGLDKNDSKRRPERRADLVIKDEQGIRIPYQILNTNEDTHEIVFLADKIPPFGYKTFGLGLLGGKELSGIDTIANKKEHVLENAILKIHINENGSFTILDKRNGALFQDQNIIEDAADHGDSYNYDPLEGDKLITTKGAKGTITIKENGPFLATYEVKTDLALPERLTSDRKARSKKLRKLPISLFITLKKDSPLVYITATIDNRMKDHRLRAIFNGVESDYVYVQTQGDVVKRRIEKNKPYSKSKKRDISHSVSKGDLPKEIGPSPTQFQRNFVGINDGEKGLIIFNKGLPEYEAKTDGTIALTLLRAIGWLSQDDLNTREKLAGPKISVPDAQCIGRHTFEYAILTQPGSWEAAPLYREENQYSIQIKCLQIPRQKGQLPPTSSFVLIKPDELMVSAIKKSYNDDEVIIRLFNPTGKLLRGSLDILPGIKDAWLTDLNEEKKRKIPVRSNGTITLEVEPKKIITISIMPNPDKPEKFKVN
jgi:alpha-mannosidase